MSTRILIGDCRDVLRALPDASVHCCVTSPPYFGLRDYGMAKQIGLEPTPDEFVAELVATFREVRRVLRDDGVLFLNLGDSYFGGGHGGGGSFASERRSWHAVPCGTSGKAPASSTARDCLCGSLCDACRKAYRIGKSRSDARRDPMPEPLLSGSTRAHTESDSDRLTTSGLTDPAGRSEGASLAAATAQDLEAGPLLVSQASTTAESSLPRQEANHQLAPTSECQLCGRSFERCAQASAGNSGCTCDTGSQSAPSATGRTDTVSSGSAYLPLTTNTLKPKDMIGIPWRVAFALQADGWYLRQDIIWHKPNPMPESVTDRCTKAHEYVFLMSKSPRYYFDAKAIAEPCVGQTPQTGSRLAGNVKPPKGQAAYDAGDDRHRTKAGPLAYAVRERSKRDSFKRDDSKRAEVIPGQSVGTSRPEREESDYPLNTRNKRSVWTIATKPYSEAHFAVMARELAENCIKAGTSEHGVCPHCGSPWARLTERDHSTSHDAESATLYDSKSTAGRLAKLRQAARAAGKEYSSSRTTTGWAAGCDCVDNEPVPATVLDPFGGSGTTGLAADQLQRNSILIELNPDYVKIAERRITGDSPMFTEVSCA